MECTRRPRPRFFNELGFECKRGQRVRGIINLTVDCTVLKFGLIWITSLQKQALQCQTNQQFLVGSVIFFSSYFVFFNKKNGFVFTKKLFGAGFTSFIHLVMGYLLLSLFSFLCWYLWGLGKVGTLVPQALKVKCVRRRK